jgi:hypothetical protein
VKEKTTKQLSNPAHEKNGKKTQVELQQKINAAQSQEQEKVNKQNSAMNSATADLEKKEKRNAVEQKKTHTYNHQKNEAKQKSDAHQGKVKEANEKVAQKDAIANGNFQVVDVPDNKRHASSTWSNERQGTGHHRGMLKSPQAWSAQHNNHHQWYQMDLGGVKDVAGVATLGRHDYSQWVTRYKVQYSSNGHFHWVDGGKQFIGNRDRDTMSHSTFAKIVKARWIKVFPTHWHSHISMRAGVIVAGGTVELARGKPTAQVSTCCAGPSARAIDGNTRQDWGGNSCTHTNTQQDPWWRVDLQHQRTVQTVKVWNRSDCCGDRLNHWEVRVGNHGSWNHNPVCGGRQGRAGGTATVACSGKKGRYLHVVIRTRACLTLCEVHVTGS